MYAVIRTGGKQYKVAENDVIAVEKLAGETGKELTISDVLALHDGADIRVGAPFVEGAAVTADVLEQRRGRKITVFKKKRRQGYRRTRGHRQEQTVLRITGILADGAKKAPARKAEPRAKAEPKPAAAPKAEAGKAPAAAGKAAPAKKAPAKTAAGAKAEAPKKPAARKAPAKKAPAKTASGTAAAKKPAAKKAPAGKSPAKKSPAKGRTKE